MEFKHPKYYKELRKRNKSDQVISKRTCDGESERAPGPGLKLPGPRPISNANKGLIHRPQAASTKHQASSAKQQASSKPEPVQVQEASSAKRQASSPE